MEEISLAIEELIAEELGIVLPPLTLLPDVIEVFQPLVQFMEFIEIPLLESIFFQETPGKEPPKGDPMQWGQLGEEDLDQKIADLKKSIAQMKKILEQERARQHMYEACIKFRKDGVSAIPAMNKAIDDYNLKLLDKGGVTVASCATFPYARLLGGGKVIFDAISLAMNRGTLSHMKGLTDAVLAALAKGSKAAADSIEKDMNKMDDELKKAEAEKDKDK
jgi:hypothetical protein